MIFGPHLSEMARSPSLDRLAGPTAAVWTSVQDGELPVDPNLPASHEMKQLALNNKQRASGRRSIERALAIGCE
jgi:hypothetical protein